MTTRISANLPNLEDRWNLLDCPVIKSNQLKYKIHRLGCDIKSILNIFATYLCILTTALIMVEGIKYYRRKDELNNIPSHHFYSHLLGCALGVYFLFPCGILLYIANNMFGRPLSMKTKNFFHGIIMLCGFFWCLVGYMSLDPVNTTSENMDWKEHEEKGPIGFYLSIGSFLSGALIVLVSQVDTIPSFLRIFIKFAHDIVGIVTMAYLFWMLLDAHLIHKKLCYGLAAYLILFPALRVLYLIYLMYVLTVDAIKSINF